MIATTRRYLITAIFAVCVLLGTYASAAAQADEPYKITGLKIVNYNKYSHIFNDITDERTYYYLNALGTSVFVSAEVSSEHGRYFSRRKVEFKVYLGKKLIKTHVGRVGYPRMGTYYVPLLLDGTYCQPLTIKARLTGQKLASSITKTLTFDCGE